MVMRKNVHVTGLLLTLNATMPAKCESVVTYCLLKSVIYKTGHYLPLRGVPPHTLIFEMIVMPVLALKRVLDWAWWLMPIILAFWESEIRRIMRPGQLGKKVCETPISMEKTWG
jgi:hypothetical protein